MLVLALLAAQLKGDEESSAALQSEFRSLPGKIEQLISRSEEIKSAAEWLSGFENTFIIAKGRQLPVAMEAALKLKEVAYLHAEAGAAGELKHGPFALLSETTPIIAIIPQDEHRTRMITAIREIATRGAPVMAIVDGDSDDIAESATSVITVPTVDQSISPIIYTVAAQLLSYYCGLERGCPIDRPRNLAKSVTVL
jgi:glucosamine--fructose-6-phosphate aminotransferase (isomerizing)